MPPRQFSVGRMTKIERIQAALAGENVDRPAWSAWYHFGLQHLDGKVLAEVEHGFYRAYDPDWLKLMHDFPYALPPGVTEIRTGEDWIRLEPRPGDDAGFGHQLEAVGMLHEALRGEAYCTDTIFSPWSYARKLAPSRILQDMREQPEALLHALGAIAESLENYVRRALARGLSGIFFSVGGASRDVMTEAAYERFGRPFDLRVLRAAQGAPFNVLHLHGKNLYWDLVRDYPVHVIHWSDRTTAPSLREARSRFGGCLAGGLNEVDFSGLRPLDVRLQVHEAIQQAGVRKLIIAPGCAIPSDTPPAAIHAIRAAVEEVRVP